MIETCSIICSVKLGDLWLRPICEIVLLSSLEIQKTRVKQNLDYYNGRGKIFLEYYCSVSEFKMKILCWSEYHLISF